MLVLRRSTKTLKRKRDREEEELEQLDRDVRRKSLQITDDALNFDEVSFDHDSDDVPLAWVKKYGRTAAQRRLRRIKAAQCSSRDAPVALKIAAAVATSAIKSNHTQPNVPQLAVALVQFPSVQAPPNYPVMIDAAASEKTPET